MITIKHPVDLPETYPLDRIGPLKDLLFFDIETTGFSGDIPAVSDRLHIPRRLWLEAHTVVCRLARIRKGASDSLLHLHGAL